MHDALDGARNTATIFIEMADPEEFQKSIRFMIDIINGFETSRTMSGIVTSVNTIL